MSITPTTPGNNVQQLSNNNNNALQPTTIEQQSTPLDALVILFKHVHPLCAEPPIKKLTTRLQKALDFFINYTIKVNKFSSPFYSQFKTKNPKNVLKLIFQESMKMIQDAQKKTSCIIDSKEFSCEWSKQDSRLFLIFIQLKPSQKLKEKNPTLYESLKERTINVIFEPSTCKLWIGRKIIASASADNKQLEANNCEVNKMFSWSAFVEYLETNTGTLSLHKFLSQGDLFKPCVSLILPNNYLHQICSLMINQLCDMHEKQLVHRDLKPENFVYQYRKRNFENTSLKHIKGCWIDMDFSFQFPKSDAPCSGTPRYLCPEMLERVINNASSASIDPRQDVYSLDPRQDVYSLGLVLSMFLRSKLDTSIYDWCSHIMSFQEKINFKRAHIIATDHKKHSELLKDGSVFDIFILSLLHPDIKQRPYMDKVKLLYDTNIAKVLLNNS